MPRVGGHSVLHSLLDSVPILFVDLSFVWWILFALPSVIQLSISLMSLGNVHGCLEYSVFTHETFVEIVSFSNLVTVPTAAVAYRNRAGNYVDRISHRISHITDG